MQILRYQKYPFDIHNSVHVCWSPYERDQAPLFLHMTWSSRKPAFLSAGVVVLALVQLSLPLLAPFWEIASDHQTEAPCQKQVRTCSVMYNEMDIQIRQNIYITCETLSDLICTTGYSHGATGINISNKMGLLHWPHPLRFDRGRHNTHH